MKRFCDCRHPDCHVCNICDRYEEELESLAKKYADAVARLDSVTVALAAYEAEPVYAWGQPYVAGKGYKALTRCRDLASRSRWVGLIRKPTSTEHLDAKIAEAVAKEREECAKVSKRFSHRDDDMGAIIENAIRARAQKEGE